MYGLVYSNHEMVLRFKMSRANHIYGLTNSNHRNGHEI